MFIEPWNAIEDYGLDNKFGMEDEAQKEIPPGHPLHGKSLVAIARRRDRDDVLFEINGGPAVACVHLTWKGKKERPGFPLTVIYKTLEIFRNTAMQEDAKEYGNVS